MDPDEICMQLLGASVSDRRLGKASGQTGTPTRMGERRVRKRLNRSEKADKSHGRRKIRDAQ